MPKSALIVSTSLPGPPIDSAVLMRPLEPVPGIATYRSRGSERIQALRVPGSTRSNMIVSVLSVLSRPRTTGSFWFSP